MMRSIKRISKTFGDTISVPAFSPHLLPATPTAEFADAISSSTRWSCRSRTATNSLQYAGPKKSCKKLPGSAASASPCRAGSGSSGEAPKTPMTCSTTELRRIRAMLASKSLGVEEAMNSTTVLRSDRASEVVAHLSALRTRLPAVLRRLPRRRLPPFCGAAPSSLAVSGATASGRLLSHSQAACIAPASLQSNGGSIGNFSALLLLQPPPITLKLTCLTPAAASAPGSSTARF
mmetsp:Transcript_86219/g.162552  ORF Transcript_86219/g.162552 Transcript_86219/m.162552 type:complete len:234 (+) Transcript_86219:33-734(+)